MRHRTRIDNIFSAAKVGDKVTDNAQHIAGRAARLPGEIASIR